jgi:DNA-binding CsgD family transcriptional regulator
VYIAIHRDELDVARAHLAEDASAKWTRALLAEASGDTATLTVLLDGYRESLRAATPYYFHQLMSAGPDLVRWFMEAGDPETAEIVVGKLEEGAQRSQVASVHAEALSARGLIDGDADAQEQAVEIYRASPRHFHRALACQRAAVALAPREPQRAIALCEEALGVFEEAGAARDVRRTEATLRALGVRRGRRGPRKRPKSGWASLTVTEQRVSALVRDGLTYREIGERLFISRRTVETHVAHVFTKLGIASRRELADAVRERAVEPDRV